MRILLITLFFPPRHNAGTENYTLGVARTLRSRNHNVSVLCAEDWQNGPDYWNGVTEETYEDIPVYRLHLNWMKAENPNKILYDSQVVEDWLDDFLVKLKPDVVHITSAVTLGAGLLRSVRKSNIPLVLTLTDFWFICPRIQLMQGDGSLCNGIKTASECQACLSTSSRIMSSLNKILPESISSKAWERASRYTWLTKKRGFRGILFDMAQRKQVMRDALALPARIFAPSRFVQEVFAKAMDINVEVLHHGHDLNWLRHFKGKLPGNNLRVAYMGQIEAIKGVHVLVEAFAKANFDGKARLDIWGDITKNPKYVQCLKDLIGDTTSITLRGRFQRDHLAAVLSEVDVLVVPSLWYENAPLVIQEAFAAKIPVIATNLGGMAEAVTNEVNGLLFERGNADDLARQLQRLITEPNLLEQLQTGIPIVRTTEDEIDELEKTYLELTQNKINTLKETQIS